MSMKELGIDKLSAAERLILAQEIWDSIDDASLADVPPWQIEEVQRRIAAYDANPVTEGRSWAEVKARIRGKA